MKLIEKLLKKRVTIPCEFILTIFSRKKKHGNSCIIQNLKYWNKLVKYNHFEIESLLDVRKIIQSNYLMTCGAFKDAFFSIPIKQDYKKYFKFFDNGIVNIWICRMDIQKSCV